MFFNTDKAKSIEKDAERQIKVQKVKNKYMVTLTDMELERLELEEKLMPKQEKIRKMKMDVDGKKALQKRYWTYRATGNSLSIVSALMTISGIAGTESLFDIGGAFTGKTGVFACTTALLQVATMNLNKNDYDIKQNHFIDYKSISKFKMGVIGISMVGNFKYMNGIMPNDWFYLCVSGAVAVLLDWGACKLNNLATDVKNCNYTNDTSKQNMTRFDKLLALVNDKFFGWIDRSYNEKFGAEKEVEKTTVTIDKQRGCEKLRNYNLHEITEQLKSMPADTIINKDTFHLSQYDWKLLRQDLEKMGLVYCKAKVTRRSKNLVEQAQDILA